MKKGFNALIAFTAITFLATSCNMAEKKDKLMDTTVATDTALQDKMVANNEAASNTNAAPDAANGTSSMDKNGTKPDPLKKGKKGKVSISMEEQAATAGGDVMDKEGYYTNIYPGYEGGQKALGNYFEKNIVYPQDATDNGVEGTVTISFAVDEKGKVSGAKTTNPTIGYGIEAEALRVFNKMPSWKPGSLKGKNVKTKYTLPVRFQLY
jgi:periplasmic protein TonB